MNCLVSHRVHEADLNAEYLQQRPAGQQRHYHPGGWCAHDLLLDPPQPTQVLGRVGRTAAAGYVLRRLAAGVGGRGRTGRRTPACHTVNLKRRQREARMNKRSKGVFF